MNPDLCLQDLLSRDAQRIWSASGAINKCHDVDLLSALIPHLDAIAKATEGVELGGGYFPNSVHLSRALARIRHMRDGKGCLCLLYSSFDEPSREAEAGRVTVLETVLEAGSNYPDYHRVVCKRCARPYKVNERDYHFTYWEWESL